MTFTISFLQMKFLISFSLLDNKTKISWTNNSKIGDTGTLEVCTCTACVWGKLLSSNVNKAWMFFFVRYHYYGIGIKETSTYYHSVYSGKGLTRFVVVLFHFLINKTELIRFISLCSDFQAQKLKARYWNINCISITHSFYFCLRDFFCFKSGFVSEKIFAKFSHWNAATRFSKS
jgi:hypothetical protein